MKRLILQLFAALLLVVSVFTLEDCRSRPTDTQQETRVDHDQQSDARQNNTRHDDARHRHHRRKPHNGNQDNTAAQEGQTQTDQRPRLTQKGAVPQKVYEVLTYVHENGRAMNGYAGGRRFGNFENLLPKTDASGRSIQYREWDVNPKIRGQNRGTERLITGSDNRAYFTNDHYNSFTEVQ